MMRRQAPLQNILFNFAMAKTPEGKRDLKTRQHLMEWSFAYAAPLGFKRARWRRLWRAQIQEYLTAATQNIKRMIKNLKKPIPGVRKVAMRIRTRFQTLVLREINATLAVSH